MVLHLNKLESSSPKDALWQVWLKLVQWFLFCFEHILLISSKGLGTSSNNLLVPLLVALEKKIFLISSMFFLLFIIISPWKRADPSFEQNGSPSPKDALCKVWLKLVQWFVRRRFLNFVNVFCYFIIISPWKRAGPFI